MYGRRHFLFLIGPLLGAISLRAGSIGDAIRHKSWVGERDRLLEIFKRKEPVKWVFTGDSITQGAKHTHGMRSFSEVFAERIRWEKGRTRDAVINTAVSGNTSKDLHDDFNWRVAQYKPDVVFIMLGTNDAADNKNVTVDNYILNLKSSIGLIRAANAIPVLITPPTIIVEWAQERKSLPRYVKAMVDLAIAEDVVLIDNNRYWSEDLKVKFPNNLNEKFMNDALHPNGFGHQVIAQVIFRDLGIFDPKEATCGGEYYEGKH